MAVIEASGISPPATIRLRQVDWSILPFETSKATKAIAYMSRKSFIEMGDEAHLWSNLCSFHGHALIGRAKDFPTAPFDLVSGNAALEELAKSRKLRVITIGSDTVDVLRSPLTPIFNSDRVVIETLPAEHAFEQFVRGRGDLMIAGLQHRLACVKSGYVEVLTSQTNPLMFGIDAMVYKGDIELALLEAVSTSWSRICRRMAQSEAYCTEIYEKWMVISKDLGVKPMFDRGDFILATHTKAGFYLKFFAGRDDAASDLIHATERVREEARKRGMSDAHSWELVRALHSIYIGADTGTEDASTRQAIAAPQTRLL